MKTLRTPDECFENLSGYDFAPNYADITAGSSAGDTLRVHYLDEGPRDAAPVLLMHGEPSWSFLYRKMIPGIVAAGHRVIAPDLVGFGRSDKPTEREDYTYQNHVDWMRALLVDTLDLNNATLFCQDWGGLIGLRLVAEHAQRFDRVVASNTFLPTGDQPAGPAFKAWLEFSQSVPEFPVGGIIDGATVSELSEEVKAGYDAPYPDETYKAGARQFPTLVPITPDDPAAPANRAAWEVLSKWDKPFLTAFGDSDPVTAGGAAAFQERVPGCKGRNHPTVVGGGHFIQEDCGEELAGIVVEFIKATK